MSRPRGDLTDEDLCEASDDAVCLRRHHVSCFKVDLVFCLRRLLQFPGRPDGRTRGRRQLETWSMAG